MPDEEFTALVVYAKDPVFVAALKQALATRATATAAMHDSASGPMQMQGGQGYGPIMPMMEGAGRILAAADGPRVGVFDIGGWDTHSNQGAGEGQLARRLQALDESFAALKTALGPAWKKTAIVAATEFGRTVDVNGTGGTDHGTAGIAFLFGGPWPAARSIPNGGAETFRAEGRPRPHPHKTRAIFQRQLSDHLRIASKRSTKKSSDSGGVLAPKDLIRANSGENFSSARTWASDWPSRRISRKQKPACCDTGDNDRSRAAATRGRHHNQVSPPTRRPWPPPRSARRSLVAGRRERNRAVEIIPKIEIREIVDGDAELVSRLRQL